MSMYLDKIETNHILDSNSSEDLQYLYSEVENNKIKTNDANIILRGGKNDRANGGFPPIFHITNQTKKKLKK